MTAFIEHCIAQVWNWLHTSKRYHERQTGVEIGLMVVDGRLTTRRAFISDLRRAEHVAGCGITGGGKSRLLLWLAFQDIVKNRGFCSFDLHGENTRLILSRIALQEQQTGQDLSKRLIYIAPGSKDFSVGLNVLEPRQGQESFVQIAEITAILKQRWQLDTFGARTEELLRNALYLLSDNHLTLLELRLLLVNRPFRARCLAFCSNPEVREYFTSIYDQASDAMQASYRNPILNKVSELVSNPFFRHLIGQSRSTFSFVEAIDQGYWVVLDLAKGQIGEHAATFGSLALSKLKYAALSRKRHSLYTFYCDEVQNLVSYSADLQTMLSELRKFNISICAFNQFLQQFPASMQAAILAVGTHLLFRLSAKDAETMSAAFDGGKSLAHLLKNLPQRHLIMKSGSSRFVHVEVPLVETPKADFQDLLVRSQRHWARSRADIEAEITQRHAHAGQSAREVLNDWQ